jgi:hypothetical protein
LLGLIAVFLLTARQAGMGIVGLALLLAASCSRGKVKEGVSVDAFAVADGATGTVPPPSGADLIIADGAPPALGDAATPAVPDSQPSPFGQGGWTLGEVQPVAAANSASWEAEAFLLPDNVTLYFASKRPGAGKTDVYVAFRPDRSAPFGQVKALDAVNTEHSESISMAPDGLTAFLATNRPGGPGGTDIWIATRASISIPWSNALFEPDPTLSTAENDYDPVLSADGLRLYYALIDAPGGPGYQDLAMATRSAPDAPFAPPTLIPDVSSWGEDSDPTLSPDERVMVFTSDRPGGSGGTDLWYAVRPDLSAPFSSPQPVPGVNTASNEGEAFISADGTELYFSSNRPGGQGNDDIYRVPILSGP